MCTFIVRFLQTLVAYHSLETSELPTGDPPIEPPGDVATDQSHAVLAWSDNSVKLASHDNPSSPEAAILEEVFTNDEATSSLTVSVDAGTITDVCNIANLPEVEILSLIEEQIPKYRLRADTITDFKGYSNEDWIQTPIIPPDTDLELTDEQIEETLKYFILCSERLSQMTKTFNDIEAVNRLLEEKERDLELAARIGQTLLEKNKELCEKNTELDDQLTYANDKVQQLKHDLSMKDELLRFYCQDLENAETESCDESPGKPFNLSSVDLDALQKRVLSLEEDNLGLRIETVKLKSNTEVFEEKEQRLVTDCVYQLNEVNEQLEVLSEELIKKIEENMRQKEEITNLLSQIVAQQKKNKTQTIETMELSKHLEAAQCAQRTLTKELAELHDRYDELFELLEEAQDELKLSRNRDRPRAVRSHYLSTPYLPTDSLASELHTSLKDELDISHGRDRRSQIWKIFETVKAAKKAAERRGTSRSSLHVPATSYSGESICESGQSSVRSSFYMSDGESAMSDGYSADLDSIQGSNTNLGRPGIPGSNDLDSALRKLALRRANELNEKDFFEDQRSREGRDRSSSTESHCARLDGDSRDCMTPPQPSWSPDSLMSVGSFSTFSGLSLTNSSQYRLPSKLQIVKPIEGSETLKRWQMLATPHFGALLEDRPGIMTRGEIKLDTATETFTLSDVEEDDDTSSCPSKRFEGGGSVYTYTDSRCARTTGNTEITPSSFARMSAIPGSNLTNVPKRKSSHSANYGMSLGLAAILNERGLHSSPAQGIGLRINATTTTTTKSTASNELVDSSYESMTTSTTNSSLVLQDPPSKKTSGKNEIRTASKLAMQDGESARSFIDRLKQKSKSLWNITGAVSAYTGVQSSSVDGPVMTKTVSDSAMATSASQSVSSASTGKTHKDNPLTASPTLGVLGALTNFRTSGLL